MQKAYDVKELGSMIATQVKADCAPAAEQLVKSIAKAVYLSSKSWIVKSAGLSKTPIDNMIVGFIDHLDSVINPQIEKIEIDGDQAT